MHDAAHWDRRYAPDDYVFGTEPVPIVVRALHGRVPGAALCLGEGEGRHAAWLAQQGHAVRSVDLSARGAEKTRSLARSRGCEVDARVGDIHALEWEPESFDIVVMVHVHPTPAERILLHRNVVASLRPGGVYVFQGFSPEHAEVGKGGPRDAERFVRADDLRTELAPLEIEADEAVRTFTDEHGRTRQAGNVWAIARRPPS